MVADTEKKFFMGTGVHTKKSKTENRLPYKMTDGL
ncbi:hypothetical protein PBAL39_18990 [Pedobacter sp. BAL39]|nr:hypothetical protein PBAL39_18990 [Pedobacter sp. BAL39]